jgi:hypothetical protein
MGDSRLSQSQCVALLVTRHLFMIPGQCARSHRESAEVAATVDPPPAGRAR